MHKGKKKSPSQQQASRAPNARKLSRRSENVNSNGFRAFRRRDVSKGRMGGGSDYKYRWLSVFNLISVEHRFVKVWNRTQI